jgi:hypothetical protein
VAPQSGAKYQFYNSAYYIPLNPTSVDQKASKNNQKILKDRVRSQNE